MTVPNNPTRSIAGWEAAELLRVGVVTEGVQSAEFRAEFLEQIDRDVRSDLDIAAPHALQQGRLMSEIARGIWHIGNNGTAVSASELRDVDRLVAVVFVREETHLQRVPRTLKPTFAPAIDVSRIGVHQRCAALVNGFLTAKLGEVRCNAFGVARKTAAPLAGLVADLLPISAAEGADVGEGGEKGIVPEVVPPALVRQGHVSTCH